MKMQFHLARPSGPVIWFIVLCPVSFLVGTLHPECPRQGAA